MSITLNNEDNLFEAIESETIFVLGGDDTLSSSNEEDSLYGGNFEDTLNGYGSRQ